MNEPLTVQCRSPWPGRPERSVQVAAGADLFTAIRGAGLPIASSCTGRVVCGKCVVGVSGPVSPAEDEERAVLAREGAEGLRLACRVVPRGAGVVVTASYW